MPQSVFVVDGVKTLPLPILRGKLAKDLARFDRSAEVQLIKDLDPTYEPVRYDDATVRAVAENPDLAIAAVREWYHQLSKYTYFVQIKDDPSRALIEALHDHTRLVSDISDARLHIGAQELWIAFYAVQRYDFVHAAYRGDGKGVRTIYGTCRK